MQRGGLEDLRSNLQRLLKIFNWRLCLSVTLDARNATLFPNNTFTPHQTIHIPLDNPDVEEYIKVELAACLEAGKLAIGDPGLLHDTHAALVAGTSHVLVGLFANKLDL